MRQEGSRGRDGIGRVRFPRTRALVLVVASFAAGAAITTAIAGGKDPSSRAPIVSLRPTGVGLPDIGATENFGVPKLPDQIRAYHDSGRYDADLDKIDGRAQRYLRKQLKRLRHNPDNGTYRKCKPQRAGRRCNRIQPALVLDIDDTALSRYAHLNAVDFDYSGVVRAVVEADSPPIQPTLELYRFAIKRDVSVFFITSHPPAIRSLTEGNLRKAGYAQWSELAMKPPEAGVVEFKRGARVGIENEGFTILANVGDQDSDLEGGHAKRAFKLPNPMYYIPAG
jgi:HAD superfamily, subfamily IIIB (Acid phosphatase)